MRWNSLTITIITLTLLLVSCSTESIDSVDTEKLDIEIEVDYTTSDFVPAIGEAPNAKPLTEPEEDPGALRLITATSTDGLNWERTNQAFIDRVGAPEAVIDNDGRIFLYYMSGTEGLEDIWVAAVSEDQGQTWVHKYVNVEGQPDNGKIADTSTILLEDGTFRSYFQSHFPGDPHGVIRSATSKDGLNWKIEEGIRITELENGNQAIAPNLLKIGDTVHIYTLYAAGGAGKQNMHFTSDDGLNFEQQQAVEANLIFANSQKINGQYITYGFHIQAGHEQHRSSLYYTRTEDGYTFSEPTLMLEEDKLASNNLEEFMLKEPAVIQLEDESFLMFYLTGFSDK